MLNKSSIFLTKFLLLSCFLFFIFLAALIFAKKPLIGSGLIFLAIFFGISLYKPGFVILAVLFAIPFDRLSSFFVYLTVAKVLIGLVIFSLIIRIVVFKDTAIIEDILSSKINLLIFLYLVTSFLSIVKAHDMELFLYIMIRRISVCVLFFLVINLFKDLRSIEAAFIVLLLSSIFVCCFGAYEIIIGEPVLEATPEGTDLFVTVEGSHRIQGVSGNPDFHAAILVMFTGLLLAIFYTTGSNLARFLLMGLLTFFALNIIATGSRGGEIGFLGVIGIFYIFHRIKMKWLKLTMLTSLLIITFIILTIFSNIPTTERFSGESGNKSIIYRYGWILMSLAMVKDNPVIGVGTGNYIGEYHKYQRQQAAITPPRPFVNHNGVMQVWTENGTLGLIVFVSLLFSLFIKSFLTVFNAVNSRVRTIALGIAAAYAGFLSCIMVFPVLEHEIGWMVSGFVVAISNLNNRMMLEV